MREKITNHSEWLEKNPEFDGENKEVFNNADGSQYIPVGIIEELLDLFTDKCWDTNCFKFSKYEDNGKGYVSGSVELTVSFDGNMLNRVGAATLSIEELKSFNVALGEKENTSFEATILSLALCNAAKKLGNRFGRSLNGRGVGKVQDETKESLTEIEKEISTVTKLMVDGKSYENAQTLFTVYPHLKNNTTLKALADSLPKYKK